MTKENDAENELEGEGFPLELTRWLGLQVAQTVRFKDGRGLILETENPRGTFLSLYPPLGASQQGFFWLGVHKNQRTEEAMPTIRVRVYRDKDGWTVGDAWGYNDLLKQAKAYWGRERTNRDAQTDNLREGDAQD